MTTNAPKRRAWGLPLPVVLFFCVVLAVVFHRRLVNLSQAQNDGPHPVYKPVKPSIQQEIVETFPLAATALSSDEIPRPPTWLQPPAEHLAETTPLFIGFTRGWHLLQQAVVSYIAAGWPPEDIYVVDNSGAQFSNQKNLLTTQNPAYLDYNRLTNIFGVNVIITPTLLTFAQLQNFFLFTAQQRQWPNYFWSHMDVVAQTDESDSPFRTLYRRAIESLHDANDCAASATSTRCIKPKDAGKPWAIRFYRYDLLALVHTQAYIDVGGWDTAIPFYKTDCDFHFRLRFSGYSVRDDFIGHIYDVGAPLPDLRQLFRENVTTWLGVCPSMSDSEKREYHVDDCRYRALQHTLSDMQHEKLNHEGGRNYWQGRQQGGQGEPYFRPAFSIQRAFDEFDQMGQKVYAEKWGHRDCDLNMQGLKPDDAWKVEKDWE